jgi:hypothetical protein
MKIIQRCPGGAFLHRLRWLLSRGMLGFVRVAFKAAPTANIPEVETLEATLTEIDRDLGVRLGRAPAGASTPREIAYPMLWVEVSVPVGAFLEHRLGCHTSAIEDCYVHAGTLYVQIQATADHPVSR